MDGNEIAMMGVVATVVAGAITGSDAIRNVIKDRNDEVPGTVKRLEKLVDQLVQLQKENERNRKKDMEVITKGLQTLQEIKEILEQQAEDDNKK